jgi:hypothetical protein
MKVMVMPTGPTKASVKVGSTFVGTIGITEEPGEFTGFDGHVHTGHRWLPHGCPKGIDGPVTRQEAALLALALAGYDGAESAKALGVGSKAGKVHV